MRVSRLAWLGTRTENREEMAQFLGHVLGLRLDRENADESVFVLTGGGKVEVFGPNAADTQHFTTGPVAGFLVDDVAAATEDLRRAGTEILSGPTFADDDVAWVHFRGPDGYVYELTQGHDLEPAEDMGVRS